MRAFNVIISKHAIRQRVVKNLFRDAIVCKTYHAQIQPQLEIFIKYSNGEVDFISLHKNIVFSIFIEQTTLFSKYFFYKPNKLLGNQFRYFYLFQVFAVNIESFQTYLMERQVDYK